MSGSQRAKATKRTASVELTTPTPEPDASATTSNESPADQAPPPPQIVVRHALSPMVLPLGKDLFDDIHKYPLRDPEKIGTSLPKKGQKGKGERTREGRRPLSKAIEDIRKSAPDSRNEEKLNVWTRELHACGFSAGLLVVKEGSAAGYQLLFEAIHRLGELEPNRPSNPASHAFPVPKAPLPRRVDFDSITKGVFAWLMEATCASSARAFVWDRRVNRPQQAWAAGLEYAEFAVSSGRNNAVPRRLLLDPEGRGPVTPLFDDEIQSSVPGSFCNRERVVASVAVLLSPASPSEIPGSVERLLLLLNFREADLEAATARGLVVGWDGQAKSPSREAAGHDQQSPSTFAEAMANTLALVTRYLNGWLQRRRLDRPVEDFELGRGSALQTAKDLLDWTLTSAPSRASGKYPNDSKGLSTTIMKFLVPPSKDASGPEHPSVTIGWCPISASDSIQFGPESQMGDAGQAVEKTAVFADAETRLLAPNSSLSLQSILWRRSCLIDLDKPQAGGSEAGWRTLRAIRASRAELEESDALEAIVPITFDSQRFGAVAVQCSRPDSVDSSRRVPRNLTPAVVEAIESAASVIAAGLHTANAVPNSAVWYVQRSARELAWRGAEVPLYFLCESIRMVARADFAYVVLFDPSRGFCRANGVSACQRLFVDLCEHCAFPFDEELSKLVARRDAVLHSDHPVADRPLPTVEELKRLSILSHALMAELLPRRDGRSWQVFASGDDWDSLRDGSQPRDASPFRANFVTASVARPFRSHPTADPVGVVWFGRVKDGGNVEGAELIAAEERAARREKRKRRMLSPDVSQEIEAAINLTCSITSLVSYQAFEKRG